MPKRKKLCSMKTVLQKAKTAASLFIRKRDNFTCFTCGKKGDAKTIDCGHYIKSQLNRTLTFDTRNMHAQCKQCNKHKNGNQDAYAVRLVRLYGADILEEFEKMKYVEKKFNRVYLQGVIDFYKLAYENLIESKR